MAKVLVVDDDKDSCETLVHLLEKAGYEATCVPNGREALIHVMTKMPDVVVLDLVMPEMDGPSFLEVVRSYLRLQSLPVVVLTALHDSPMIDRAQALKVNSILVKGRAIARRNPARRSLGADPSSGVTALSQTLASRRFGGNFAGSGNG